MNITDLLTENEKQYLLLRKLQKDETLFHEGDRCRQIGIILKGSVAIVSYLPDGEEIIYNRLSEDGIFGNNLLFSSDPCYKGNVIAQSNDTLIALILKEDLIRLLKDNEAFLSEYLRIQSDQGKQLNSRIRILSTDSAEARFFSYMHDHHDRVTYLSVSDLAKDLYLSREALSRLLSRLEKEKRIIRERKTIHLL
ncbi:MAG: Crp/Fnr family transcriptional regulator [Erysipelotrichaceae bacterium]|nr:Crp/Fnr family transcriptional regulator [Erysipelotrichaceae bacterium]